MYLVHLLPLPVGVAVGHLLLDVNVKRIIIRCAVDYVTDNVIRILCYFLRCGELGFELDHTLG